MLAAMGKFNLTWSPAVDIQKMNYRILIDRGRGGSC